MNQAPKNQTEDRFDPEFVHEITFGSPPRNSLPMQLVGLHEWTDMIYGSGKFQGIKRTISMTNAEIYQYLRLGVSTQSASLLKWLGYQTPESLVESEATAPLLPDHLARTGVKYPVKFIELCETEGVSALVCQSAIRRGMSERHLQGPLSLNELLFVFTNLVKKNVTMSEGGDIQPNLANMVCDGIIPFELVKEGDVGTPAAVIIAKEIFVAEPESELANRLRSDAKLFRSFARVLTNGRSTSHSVNNLRKLIDEYGYKVLDLINPSLCFTNVKMGDDFAPIGYEGALYVEQFVGCSGRSWHMDQINYGTTGKYVNLSPSNGGWMDTVKVNYWEINDLRIAGIEPVVAYEHVVNGRMAVSTLIAAQRDGVETALMGGAL